MTYLKGFVCKNKIGLHRHWIIMKWIQFYLKVANFILKPKLFFARLSASLRLLYISCLSLFSLPVSLIQLSLYTIRIIPFIYFHICEKFFNCCFKCFFVTFRSSVKVAVTLCERILPSFLTYCCILWFFQIAMSGISEILKWFDHWFL